jgi:hypothetical protein
MEERSGGVRNSEISSQALTVRTAANLMSRGLTNSTDFAPKILPALCILPFLVRKLKRYSRFEFVPSRRGGGISQ